MSNSKLAKISNTSISIDLGTTYSKATELLHENCHTTGKCIMCIAQLKQTKNIERKIKLIVAFQLLNEFIHVSKFDYTKIKSNVKMPWIMCAGCLKAYKSNLSEVDAKGAGVKYTGDLNALFQVYMTITKQAKGEKAIYNIKEYVCPETIETDLQFMTYVINTIVDKTLFECNVDTVHFRFDDHKVVMGMEAADDSTNNQNFPTYDGSVASLVISEDVYGSGAHADQKHSKPVASAVAVGVKASPKPVSMAKFNYASVAAPVAVAAKKTVQAGIIDVRQLILPRVLEKIGENRDEKKCVLLARIFTEMSDRYIKSVNINVDSIAWAKFIEDLGLYVDVLDGKSTKTSAFCVPILKGAVLEAYTRLFSR